MLFRSVERPRSVKLQDRHAQAKPMEPEQIAEARLPGHGPDAPQVVHRVVPPRDAREEEQVDVTRGPMISRFSFTIDVREWGFADPRSELVNKVRASPEVRAIVEADVWDERGEERAEQKDAVPTDAVQRPAV